MFRLYVRLQKKKINKQKALRKGKAKQAKWVLNLSQAGCIRSSKEVIVYIEYHAKIRNIVILNERKHKRLRMYWNWGVFIAAAAFLQGKEFFS